VQELAEPNAFFEAEAHRRPGDSVLYRVEAWGHRPDADRGTAALEYATKGIRVNAVCPGTIDTAIARAVVEGDEKKFEALSKASPIGRIGKPEEIASVVLWLCSPGAS
jgi:enoyl-ACP reductase-like protein